MKLTNILKFNNTFGMIFPILALIYWRSLYISQYYGWINFVLFYLAIAVAIIGILLNIYENWYLQRTQPVAPISKKKLFLLTFIAIILVLALIFAGIWYLKLNIFSLEWVILFSIVLSWGFLQALRAKTYSLIFLYFSLLLSAVIFSPLSQADKDFFKIASSEDPAQSSEIISKLDWKELSPCAASQISKGLAVKKNAQYRNYDLSLEIAEATLLRNPSKECKMDLQLSIACSWLGKGDVAKANEAFKLTGVQTDISTVCNADK